MPDEYGVNSRLLTRIDEIAKEGIKEGAYPGCQIVILKDGKEMYNKAFGTHTWPGTSASRLSASVTPGATFAGIPDGCLRSCFADKDYGNAACRHEAV